MGVQYKDISRPAKVKYLILLASFLGSYWKACSYKKEANQERGSHGINTGDPGPRRRNCLRRRCPEVSHCSTEIGLKHRVLAGAEGSNTPRNKMKLMEYMTYSNI